MENKKTLEVTGKSPEDAIAKGLAQLGLDSDDVIIEVVSQGGAESRVRLTPFPTEAARGARAPLPPNADVASVGKDVLAHLLQGLGLRATIETSLGVLSDDEEEEHTEPPTILNITGNDLSLLIGRKGETLAALQMMTRLIASHRIGRNVSIVVDVEHYKERREESLRNLALRLAEQVAVKGRTVALEPMPPNERRIIHLTLRGNPDVTTESNGEGNMRRITVQPA